MRPSNLKELNILGRLANAKIISCVFKKILKSIMAPDFGMIFA